MRRFLHVAAFLLVIGGARIAVAAEPAKDADRAAKIAERDRLWADAKKLRDEGKHADAIKRAKKMLVIEQKLFGKDHADLISSCDLIGELAETTEDWELAGKARREAERIATITYGKSNWRTTDARLACEYVARLRRLSAADVQALRGAIAESAQVGRLYSASQYDDAVKLAVGVVKTRERLLGPDHPDTATSLNNLALLHHDQGNYAAAEPLYQRALAIWEKALGPNHPDTARSLNNLAALYDAQGNYAAAEPLYQRALAIREKALGPDHRDTATSLNNLAKLYADQANYAAAEPLYQRALAIWEKALGPDHPDTARSLNNLAGLYKTQGNYAAAEPLYQRALAIWEKALGPNHPDTARSLNNLAVLHHDQGNYAAAEPLYQRALAIREKALGPNHPDTAHSLNSLAALYDAQGNYAAAEPLYQRALAIREKALGSDHPDTALSLHDLSQLCWLIGRTAAAGDFAGRGLDIQIRHLDRTAAIQTEEQQFLMERSVACHFHAWLTVTSAEADKAADTWRYVLAWKGLTTSRQLGLRQALKDDAAFAEYRRIGQQLSTLTLNPPLPPAAPTALAAWNARAPELRRRWQERKQTLELEWERLEKQLAQKSAVFRQAREAEQVTPAMVAARLARDAALVDLVEYWYSGRANEPSEWRVAAFVVRGDGRVERIELGASESIKQQIAAWRQSFGRHDGANDSGAELRRALWEPIAAHLKDVKTVLISPDGVLAQLPWGALPGEKQGTYLIEERALAVISTPQLLPELLDRQRSGQPPRAMLLAGDIDYGADAGAPVGLLADSRAAGRTRDGKLLAFGALESAQAELASIERRYLKKVRDGESDTLEGAEATEAAFRDQAGRHEWLHVITHGFFAPETIKSALRDLPDDAMPRGSRTTATNAPAPPAGIGAGLQVSKGKCIVTQVVAAGGAAKDGRLKVGDEIVAAAPANGDWTPLANKPLDDIVALIRGPAGSIVRLKVRPKAKPDEEIELEITRAALPTAVTGKSVSVHPGLLSGLAFAGANSPPEEGKDDGILTALEVSALDLSQVDTVVLSACETGLGEVAGGEGLLGLQRAFQVAGAKTVVASLWKVPDRATSTLMQRFYENLWDKKMGKLAALREAQIWMMRDKGNRGLALGDDAPDPNAPLPPYFWAAFVLSGDWR